MGGRTANRRFRPCSFGRRIVGGLLAMAWLCMMPAVGAPPGSVPPAKSMSIDVASRFADQIIAAAETAGLPPRDPLAYARLKDDLRRTARTGDRELIYAAARALLETLDTDGHTMLWSKEEFKAYESSTSADSATSGSAVRVLRASAGPVLVVQPPRATFTNESADSRYASVLIQRIGEVVRAERPCGLVVDLSAQVGGNAYPPLAVLDPLISSTNLSRLVDRDGGRTPIAPLVHEFTKSLGHLPINDLALFAGHPFAVSLGPETASAGEMVAIILKGERKARSFGWPTVGATSGNAPFPLVDGGMLVLTVSRYSLGNAPPLRGRLTPDTHAGNADTPGTVPREAVEWAAQIGCRADPLGHRP